MGIQYFALSIPSWVDYLDFWRFVVFGYVFIIAGGAMSWQSHKQPTMAFPSPASRYLVVIWRKALWLWQLLKDLGFVWDGPTCLHCDNRSCIKLIQNACFHDPCKRIELQFHFLQEKVDLSKLKLHFTSTETSGLIFITKSLPMFNHVLCSKKLWGLLKHLCRWEGYGHWF
jgi:hypothetical protein